MLYYVKNRFETATRGSFRLMLILVIDHVSRLTSYLALYSEAVIQQILNRTVLVKNDYIAYYTKWHIGWDNYRGETLRFEMMINELRANKISQWGTIIKTYFPKNSPELMSLLPNGYAPFQKGAYEVRINRVGELGDKLLSYPQLSALQAEVQAYYTELVNTRDKQQQYELLVKNASVVLHKKRQAVARLLHGNVGLLLNKFYNTPEEIEQFFDVELLSSTDGEGGGVVTVRLFFHTDQTTKRTVEVGILLPAGKTVEIHWGDGLKQTITSTGSSIFVNHDYDAEGVYKISFVGDIPFIEEFHSNNSALIYGVMKGLTALRMFVAQGNNFDTEAVDNFLIMADKSGIENGIFNLLNSASPSSKGLAAKARLESKGWVVLTN